jgi:hypothetical protein
MDEGGGKSKVKMAAGKTDKWVTYPTLAPHES